MVDTKIKIKDVGLNDLDFYEYDIEFTIKHRVSIAKREFDLEDTKEGLEYAKMSCLWHEIAELLDEAGKSFRTVNEEELTEMIECDEE